MINVLLLTHGRLGQEFLVCAESVVGRQACVRVLGLDLTEGPEIFEKKVEQELSEMNSTAGVLVLADMLGSTPCNVALRLCRNPHVFCDLVTGVNLPMLISALTNRYYMPLTQLAQKLVDDMPRNAVRPLRKLGKSLEEPGQHSL